MFTANAQEKRLGAGVVGSGGLVRHVAQMLNRMSDLDISDYAPTSTPGLLTA